MTVSYENSKIVFEGIRDAGTQGKASTIGLNPGLHSRNRLTAAPDQVEDSVSEKLNALVVLVPRLVGEAAVCQRSDQQVDVLEGVAKPALELAHIVGQ